MRGSLDGSAPCGAPVFAAAQAEVRARGRPRRAPRNRRREVCIERSGVALERFRIAPARLELDGRLDGVVGDLISMSPAGIGRPA